MGILGEVFETLGGLLALGGPGDPTFQRMAGVYRDVTEALGCRADYDRMLAGLLSSSREDAGAARTELLSPLA